MVDFKVTAKTFKLHITLHIFFIKFSKADIFFNPI